MASDRKEIMPTAEQIVKAIQERSEECERGIIALRSDGMAGLALFGPNSVVLSVALVTHDRAAAMGAVADLSLN
jgi:hypothetical protein